MRILIEGIGSIGGIIAARLIGAGFSPTLVTGNEPVAAAINANGIEVRSSDATHVSPATACERLDELPAGTRYDAALLIMKANAVVDAAQRTLPWLAEDGYVVPLQNGVVEPAVVEVVGRERVIGSLLNWGATMHAPGVYEQTIDGNIAIGELDGSMSARLSTLESVLGHVCPTFATDNIVGALWSKLALNCSITALGGLSGLTLADNLSDPRGRELFLTAYREVLDVARSRKISLVRLSIDPQAPADPERVDAALADLERIYGKSRPSILQSLERGRKTEIDSITGYLAETAIASGLSAPVNRAITEIIHEIENGDRVVGRSNIDELWRRTRARG